MFYKQIGDMKKMAANMKKQGKTKQQIKQAISNYLVENKKKTNPNGDKDII